MNKLDELAKVIKEEIELLFQLILESQYGYNTRAHKNTLAKSKLHDELLTDGSNWIFKLQYNDYIEYIESGRKPKANKVPVQALLTWAKEKGLPTDNSFIFAVRENIYKNGIPPRAIISPYSEEIDKQWNDWAERIFEAITEPLNKYFSD